MDRERHNKILGFFFLNCAIVQFYLVLLQKNLQYLAITFSGAIHFGA